MSREHNRSVASGAPASSGAPGAADVAGEAGEFGEGGPLLLAIDNGSQSTKVNLVDARGRVIASGRQPLRPAAHPHPGRVEHPDDDLWDSIAVACREAMANFEGDPARIVGVGLCTIRFCRALLDAGGALVSPVMSWMDERLARPYEHRDDRVAFVSTSSGYLAGRLTGNLVDFAGNTQGRWPIDAETWEWSDDDAVIEREGVPRHMLLPLAQPGERIGDVTASAAAETGLPAGVPVFATSNDKAVEALGSGLLDADDLLLSLGTYVAAMTPGEPRGSDASYAARLSTGAWRNFGAIPGATLDESAGVRRGMWTVSWYRDLVFGSATERDAGAPADGERERQLEREATEVAPGCGGLTTVLDWLAPDDEPFRRGAFIGFDGTQGRGHLHRSILEALAVTMSDNAAELLRALGRTPRGLIVTGGGAKSALMLRILAATFDLPVRRTEVSDAAGLGAAITAAVGTGVHASWREAASAMVRDEPAVLPEPDLVEAYRAIASRHRRIRHGLAELLQQVDAPSPQ